MPQTTWTNQQIADQCRDLSRAIVEVTQWADVDGTTVQRDLVDELRSFGESISAVTVALPNVEASEDRVRDWSELRSRAVTVLQREVAGA